MNLDTAVKPGDRVMIRDARDKWHDAIADSAIEPTHAGIDENGQRCKIHDFPVIWVVVDGIDRMPWPAADVELADH